MRIKRLQKNGGSTAVNIPKAMLEKMLLKAGDYVRVSQTAKYIIIEKALIVDDKKGKK